MKKEWKKVYLNYTTRCRRRKVAISRMIVQDGSRIIIQDGGRLIPQG
jgi:hypothetical protein